MKIKYDIDFSNDAIIKNINRIKNQIFKLLPNREEGGDWESPLQNLIIELTGMNELILNQDILFFQLLCKMEAMLSLKDENEFFMFRKCVFECLKILGDIEAMIK